MTSFSPIAIIGQGCVLPGALTPSELWELVLAKRSAISPAPPGEWRLEPWVSREALRREVSSDVGGHVRGFDAVFDPHGFDDAVGALDGLDPVFLWTLHAAREALRSANLADGTRHPDGLVILGNLSYPTPALVELALATWGGETARPDARNRFMSGLPAQLTANALRFGRGGFALDAACASSLYAIKLACDKLHDGDADLVLAGGVNHAESLFLHLGFTALAAQSPTGQSRPFHRGADGLIPAQGAAVVLLKRLVDAETTGDRILGVIRGIGLSNDGRGRGLLVPTEDGQVRAMRAAYAMSGVDPRAISLVECHATGTPVGDATEVRSMVSVFADAADLPIGSLKSNLGHLITASGTAALLKVIAAIGAGVRPATLHAEEPIDDLHGGPLRLLKEAESWRCDGPRRAAISNFGFGGNNAHLIVEEWQAPASRVSVAANGVSHAARAVSLRVAVIAQTVTTGARVGVGAFESALFDGAQPASAAVGGAAGEIDLDVARLRFPPADLRESLPQQLLLMKAALDLGGTLASLPAARTGLFVGMGCDAEVARCSLRWRRAGAFGGRSTEGPLSPALVLGCMPNVVANRLGSQLDFQAPTFTVSAEEASGVVALEIGARALRTGEVDAAVVAAVDLSREPVHEGAVHSLLPVGRQSTTDAVVVLVLKRLEDAQRDGDTVLAVLEGGETPADLHLKLTSEDAGVGPILGNAHAASGLLHVAVAVAACAERALPRRADRAAMPWLPSATARRADVEVHALGGLRTLTAVRAVDRPRRLRTGAAGARLAVFGARDVDGLIRDLERGATSPTSAFRVAIVARDDAELSSRTERAVALLRSHDGTPATLDDGIHFGAGALRGELGFVFTGPAGAYAGMGRELALALPELVDSLGERMSTLRDAAGWLYEQPAAYRAKPVEKLWGSSFLIQLHAELTRGLLGMRPTAAIGYCSGETNALFAMGAWGDLDGFRRAIDERGVYTRELCGELAEVRRAWGAPAGVAVEWSAVRVRAPIADVRSALAVEPRVHLTIVNAPGDVVIAGEPAACARVVEKLGARRARTLDYDFVMHCPEARGYADTWRELHHRPTAPVPGVRFYTHATLSSYAPTADAVADALTGQAMSMVDFPALIERAWADGIRVFVEHGPHAGCTKWIGDVLGEREHVAVALDRYGRSSLLEATESVARLVAAGVPMDHEALASRLRPQPREVSAPGRSVIMSFPSHFEPVRMPEISQASKTAGDDAVQRMAPAPRLPTAVAESPRRAVSPARTLTTPQPAADEAGVAAGGLATSTTLHGALTALHIAYLRGQAATNAAFLRVMLAGDAPPAVRTVAPALQPVVPEAVVAPIRMLEPARVTPPSIPQVLVAPSAPAILRVAAGPRAASGPSFTRRQLKVLSSGKVSSVFGPLFEQQDRYERQVRMPEPPLLLADRVLGIEGEAGAMGVGTIWTETDVTADAWYLHQGRMPAGILVESGQADLLLISWLGIDFHNRGERVYRLLGCELTSHGELPKAGDTLTYEIHVDGHARQGDIRLFFFHYDCWVNGEKRVSVRNGQAGFFTDEELATSAGILWSADDEKPTEGARLDAAVVDCTKQTFSRAEVDAFARGDAYACFGRGFERLATHTLTPSIQADRMRLLDEVTHFDPSAGPWGRGYLRARLDLQPSHWFFQGHFKNDPCMPGTLMFEGCLQALSIYMAALGLTIAHDGWRFEPVPEHAYHLRCRGQALPTSKEVVYEVFIDEIVAGPYPTIYADLLGSVDGLKAFHCRRMGLRLVPAWPMDAGRLPLEIPPDGVPVARVDGFDFGLRSLLACALGRPSEAFGKMYSIFDDTRRVARLPSPPYHFMSRVVRADGPIGGMHVGSIAEVAYDVPRDAWYFAENSARVMPYAVLLEVALQPCGWLASYIGSACKSDIDLVFRNLDGNGTVHREVHEDVGTLTTTTRLTSLSTAGGLVILGFDVKVLAGAELVYGFTTVFGFFTADTMKDQVGLAKSAEDLERLHAPSDPRLDLTALRPRPGATMLALVDRVSGLWLDGGKAGLGRIRAEKDVDPTAWFFKAHFFQDPVQPGSLGIEALLQALQMLMTERGMTNGLASPRFEAIAVGSPMTWKYRGQVVPENKLIVAELEISEIIDDDQGRKAVADGSLWVDGKRIYEVRRMAMRVVPGDPTMVTPPSSPAFDRARAKAFWRDVTGASGGWLGEDILFALADRFVGKVELEDPRSLDRRRGRPTLYLANHQVGVETILAAIVIGGMTGTIPTLPAKAEHRGTWVGDLMSRLTARPGIRDPRLIRFVDRQDPASVLRLRGELQDDFRQGRSALVHVEGTRAKSSRHRVATMSSVFLDLAIEAGVDVVPVRFIGGLPDVDTGERFELPLGYGRQDYWFGQAIGAEELAALPFGARTQRVLSAINSLGVDPRDEASASPDPDFGARVRAWREKHPVAQPEAAMAVALAELSDPSDEGRQLLARLHSAGEQGDSSALGVWRESLATWLLGPGCD